MAKRQPGGVGRFKTLWGRLNYPRAGRGKIMRWLPSWRMLLTLFTGLFVTGLTAVLALYIFTDIPKPGDFAKAQTTTVYYSDGKTEMGRFADYDRQTVDVATLPEHVKHAVVASEDRTFYTNSGVDYKGIVRAAINNLRGKPRQGASTLTQQYAETYYTGRTTSYVGKVKELILALKIDSTQNKDQILGNYLNTIYFGRGAYGIERAAQLYFGVAAKDLTIAQSALLAGIIPAPSAWDPAKNPAKAKQRFERVLNLMLEDGWITSQERAAATYPEVLPRAKNSAVYSGPGGHILRLARQELVRDAGITEDEIDTRGLRIITTIDADKQAQAVKTIRELPAGRPENNRIGLVSLDNKTAGIVAMYGGADYLKVQRNTVTQDHAQAGSTFKIFTLLAALDDGVTLRDRFDSSSPLKLGETTIRNFDNRGRGRINLVSATANSVNTAYVRVNQQIGADKTKEAAIRAGLSPETPGLDDNLANTLGSAAPRNIEMASAFSMIARGGNLIKPHVIREVRDAGGAVIFREITAGKEAFSKDVTGDAVEAMSAVMRGTGKRANIAWPAAGKTGTSSDYKSAWFVGFTNQFTTAVSMYQVGANGSEETLTPFGGVRYMEGGQWPARIWRSYMNEAMKGLPKEKLTERQTKAPAPAPAPEEETPAETPPPTEAPAPQPQPAPKPETKPQPEQPPAKDPAPEPGPKPPSEETKPTTKPAVKPPAKPEGKKPAQPKAGKPAG